MPGKTSNTGLKRLRNIGIAAGIGAGLVIVSGLAVVIAYNVIKSHREKQPKCKKRATLYFGCQFSMSAVDDELSPTILQLTESVPLQGRKPFLLLKVYMHVHYKV